MSLDPRPSGPGPFPTRRQFLGVTAAATATLATGCATRVPRVDPVGVVDTHTHFYDPTRPDGVPWPPKDDRVLYRPVYPAEFQEVTRRFGVTGTVVVEASPWPKDNQWLLDLAEKNDFILGIVGHLKPAQPEFAAELRRYSANPLFRGIRIGVWNAAPLTDAPLVRDLGLLADLDLSLDVLVGPERLAEVAALAGALPHLRIVVDHCANVRVLGASLSPAWSEGLSACSPHRNVFMKVSGLVEGTGRNQGDAPSELNFYRPTLDAVWQAFGEHRVIYGSNWPVSARFAPYERVFSLVAEYFHGKGQKAADAYFTRNAVRAYRIAAR